MKHLAELLALLLISCSGTYNLPKYEVTWSNQKHVYMTDGIDTFRIKNPDQHAMFVGDSLELLGKYYR